MNETKAMTYTDFVLPPSVVSKVDLSRMLGELERVNNELVTARIHAENGVQAQMPVLSKILEDFLVQNRMQLDGSKHSLEIIKQLRLLKDKAPVLHMTFAVNADGESLQQLASWVRREVHPQALISVGLQPTLVAGVHIRTPNRMHDFSMRGLLAGSHDLLIKDLEALRGAK